MNDITDTCDPIEAYPETDFPIKVDAPPAISTFPNGITYAISGGTWIPIPSGSTREDLPKWMNWDKPEVIYDEEKITGSRGDIYTLRRNQTTNEITCSCPGFKWRGKCKHRKAAFAS
jgi:hypothetical protein